MSTQATAKAANTNCCSSKRCDEAQPCTAEGFQRPRFFAGQLLTEDDLESLSSYVVGKNRLHNRYLWGDGVACGLEVKPHPCGGGRVLVESGYALDCCGNDLLLPCEEELDINALVRQLRIDLRGGYDCGDPCADATTGTGSGSGASITEPVSEWTEIGKGSKQAADKTERYCLYLRYSETQSDPVSPYQVDEPCSGSSCEWTRINEGVRFELRCYTPPCDENELCERIKDCLGDVYALENNLTQATDLQQAVILYRQLAAPAGQAAVVPLLRIDDGAALSNSADTLDEFFIELEEKKANPETMDSAKVVKAMNAAADASAYLTRYRLMKEEERGSLLADADKAAKEGEGGAAVPLTQVLTRVSKLVKKLDKVEEPVVELHVKDPLILESSKSALRIVKSLGGDLSPLPEAQALDSETRQLALKTFATPETFRIIGERFTSLQGDLIQRLSSETDPVHRNLLFNVQSKSLPVLGSGQRLGVNQMIEFTEVGELVVGGYQKLLQDCLCNALLPECSDCEDPVVLLACLEVKECEVVDICNMVRKFLITPPNLRYWFPVIGKLGQGLTAMCCPDTRCEPQAKPAPGDDKLFDYQSGYSYGVQSSYRYSQMASLASSTRLLSLLLGDCLKFDSGKQIKAAQSSNHAVQLMYQLSGGGTRTGLPPTGVPPKLPPETPPRIPPKTPPETPPTWIPIEDEKPRTVLESAGMIDWTAVPFGVAPPADFIPPPPMTEIDIKTVLESDAARDAVAGLVEEKVNKLVKVETGTDVDALVTKKLKAAEAKGAAEMERLMKKKLAEADKARAAEVDKLVAKKLEEVVEVRLNKEKIALDAELKKRLAVKELTKVVDGSTVVKRLNTSIKNLEVKNRDLEREVKRLQGS